MWHQTGRWWAALLAAALTVGSLTVGTSAVAQVADEAEPVVSVSASDPMDWAGSSTMMDTDLTLMSATAPANFSISGRMQGNLIPDSSETAVCVESGTEGDFFTATDAYLNTTVAAGTYQVLTFEIDPSWLTAQVQGGKYLEWYHAFDPVVRLRYGDSSVTGDLYDVNGFTDGVLTYIRTQIVLAPTGVTVPVAFANLPRLTVAAGAPLNLLLGIGLIGGDNINPDQVPAATLEVTSDTYNSGSTLNPASATASTVIPEFAQVWVYWREAQNNCNNTGSPAQDPPPDIPTPVVVPPTITKTFTPALVQAGGTSTLTFTITNNATGTATHAWSFTDQLPSLDLHGNPDTPLSLKVAPNPGWTATGCNLTSQSAPAGSSTIGVAGNIVAGQAACVITVTVLADAAEAATISSTQHLGYFDPYHPDFAFPVDLSNSIDGTSAPNTGLSGAASAILRVEVPSLKVDVSPPTFSGDDPAAVQVSWMVTVLNATNILPSGEFTSTETGELLPAQAVTVTSTLGTGLTNPVWGSVPAGATSVTQDNGTLTGTWEIPALSAGQFLQAQISATITDLAEFLPTVDNGATTTQSISNTVAVRLSALANPQVTQLPNEVLNDETRTAYAATWAGGPGNFPMPSDTYRIASVEADSDQWDQDNTVLGGGTIDLNVTAGVSAITEPSSLPLTYTVTNTSDFPLANVRISDGLWGGVICHLTQLAANTSDSTCIRDYEITAAALAARQVPQPVGATEGIWLDEAASYSAFHLQATATATAAYLNPATSQNPQGNWWVVPSAASGNQQITAQNSLVLPIYLPADLAGWLTLPMTGGSGERTMAARIFPPVGALFLLMAVAYAGCQKSRSVRLSNKGG